MIISIWYEDWNSIIFPSIGCILFWDMLWICHQWRLGFKEHRDTPRTHKTWRFRRTSNLRPSDFSAEPTDFNRPHHFDSLSDLLFHVQKACSYNRLRWAIFMYLKKKELFLIRSFYNSFVAMSWISHSGRPHKKDLRFKKFHSNCHVKSESLTLR